MAVVKDVPQRPYAVIVTQFHVDPDWAYSCLRCVEDRDKKLKVRKYRIFDNNKIPGDFKINGFVSFDSRPDLLMFEAEETDDGEVNVTRVEAKLAT